MNTRPVLLLSRDQAYSRRAYVTVAPVTRTTVRLISSHVPLGPAEGLRTASMVNLDSILTIPKRLLELRIGQLSPDKMRGVEEAIRFALELPAYQR